MSAVSAERVDFFYRVRVSLFGGRISSSQCLGMRAKLDEFKKRSLTDLRWLAYILATSYHETGKHMMPVREGFASNDADARRIVAGREYGKPDPWTGQVYYGRGDVQLTWRKNYDLMGHLLNLPLVANPDLALKPDVSSAIMFEGMIQGLFTGKKLADFFNGDRADWVNARQIINRLDRAELIAGYAKAFHAALTNGGFEMTQGDAEDTVKAAATATAGATVVAAKTAADVVKDTVTSPVLIGAAAGAGLGSVVPVVGTAVGAVLGASIGWLHGHYVLAKRSMGHF